MVTEKLCNFTIRNYIQISLEIRTIGLCTPKNCDIFNPLITWGKKEGKYLDIFSVQRHNFCADFK